MWARLVRLKALMIKELLAILRDPKTRLVLIGPPLLQLVVFSFAATQEVKNVTLAVLDIDRGVWSRELIARFRGSPTFTDVRLLGSLAEMRAAIDRQEALVAVTIGSDFSRQVEAGAGATLQVILDGRRSNASQIVTGYVLRVVDDLGASVAADMGAGAPASIVVTRNWFNPNLNFQWHTVPALVGMLAMLIGILLTALSVARERELGTFDQLLVSPITPTEIMIGKMVPSLFLGVMEGTLILTAGVVFFRIPITGSLGPLYLAMTVFLAAVVGIGLFISSLAKTQQQGILGAFTFAAPAILLSGWATPIENMPAWLQPVAWSNPVTYFLIIVKGVFLKAMPFAEVWANTWPMAVIAVFTLTAATILFRRRLG